MNLDPQVVRALVVLVIPVLVGLVTKASASDRVKAVVTIVLAGVGTLIVQATADDGSAVISAVMAWDWLVTTALAVAAYLGILKPVVGNGDLNSKLAPSKGIG
jgi:hypothetical protein